MPEGLFWTLDVDKGTLTRGDRGEDAREKTKRTRQVYVRERPPVPVTGWEVPTEFPDLSGAKVISLDTETYDPGLQKGRGPAVRSGGYIAGVAVGTDDGYRRYFPIRHQGSSLNLDADKVFAWLGVEFGRRSQPKVGHNLLYDLDYLAEAGVEVQGELIDTSVAEALIDERGFYSLEALGRKYLGEGKVTTALDDWATQAFGDKWKGNVHECPPELVGPYGEGDVDLPLRVFEEQKKRLDADELWRVFSVESRLIPMLLAMRRRGVRIDVEAAHNLDSELTEIKTKALDELTKLTGYAPDIWSAASVSMMFDSLKISYPHTETGLPSFTKKWLTDHPHPAAQLLQRARKADKFKSTFIDGHIFGSLIGDRIHTQFHQLKGDDNGTVSGRLSSSDPNLQNIPIRDKVLGPLLRALFIPDDGKLWWAKDWSQVEYRLLGHFAVLTKLPGAEAMAEMYRKDLKTDFHQMLADLTGLSRSDAKNTNFAQVYGQGLPAFAAAIGKTIEEAKVIRGIYHERAPYIKALEERVKKAVTDRGYIKTMLGRRRRYTMWEDWDKNIYSEPGSGRKRAYINSAVNALIQGSAADCMKIAMVQQWEAGVYEHLGGAPLLTVHDELDGDIDRGNKLAVEALAELHRIMENCVTLEVPLLAEGGEGKNWAEAK